MKKNDNLRRKLRKGSLETLEYKETGGGGEMKRREGVCRLRFAPSIQPLIDFVPVWETFIMESAQRGHIFSVSSQGTFLLGCDRS